MINKITYILLSFFLLVSCQQEEVLKQEVKGTLLLKDVCVEAEVSVQSTKTDNFTYYIVIKDKDEKPVGEETLLNGEYEIALSPGKYKIEAYNEAYKNYTTWSDDYNGEAIYYIMTELIEIIAEEETEVSLNLPMINAAITYSDEWLKDKGYTDIVFIASIGTRSVQLSSGEYIFTSPISAEYPQMVNYGLSAVNKDGDGCEKMKGSVTLDNSVKKYIVEFKYEINTGE